VTTAGPPSTGARRGIEVALVGVPFSSTGRRGGIADAARVLRAAGLRQRLSAVAPVHDHGDLPPTEPSTRRGPSGLLDEHGLTALVTRTRVTVAAALRQGRRPLLIGGDCPVVLGALAALKEANGRAGLVMADGHEDAWPPRSSPTGEASDSELGIALEPVMLPV
jgi:arginase